MFHAVHINLSQDGRPWVEEVTAIVPEPSSSRTPNRDRAQTPSLDTPLPPPLPSTSSNGHAYTQSISTPTSKIFSGHQSQSQSVSDLPSPSTDCFRSGTLMFLMKPHLIHSCHCFSRHSRANSQRERIPRSGTHRHLTPCHR